ncbi:hypothetical protein M430DRAFT_20542 [Amorphotheca resinae ATCC 22711]|uniref:Uncharacterized protein n=1 Tax=Amorphotheca resinae ATCC 22711 TaxID=857342 RepID=A0A2T3AYW7_AMORE|nr:hypothetical protein M430DRAFT_20542 [Amorphotheca resinae ATCC 22711]PSS15240.1 hypothetical protein M430DRAFT_20542 [Amorphotheca resinae ATCC 22711]
MASERVTRYQPCYILRDSGIPCVIWCEDAVAHYGVPTVVFSFYILVPDIDKAANVLTQRGWHLEDSGQTKFGNYPLRSAHHRLTPPIDVTQNRPAWSPGMGPPPPPSKGPPRPTTTILLPASEWNYTFPLTIQNLFPPLPELLDALIDKLLDDPLTDGTWHQLALLIAYLYDYVPALREKSYAENLKYEHRQFHYDSLSGMSIGLPFIRHERKIRDALREGSFQLCDCSADQEDESLFTAKAQARIIASRPSPFTAEEYEADKKRAEEEERRLWLEDE